MYDLIGDIHGHADELIRLLEALGYENSGGVYKHADRKAIFVGDFIDRGPKIRQALQTVRPMVEAGHALAVMGNHELNALAFHAEQPRGTGTFLRKRSIKNIRQHGHTLLQLTDEELFSALEWFRTLPMWLDLDGLRVVHACWDDEAVQTIDKALQEHGGVSDEFLRVACTKGNKLFDAVDIVLKGKEAHLPEGQFFLDKDGHRRQEIRTRWFEAPEGLTYGTYAFQSPDIECDIPLLDEVIRKARPYPRAAKPVFFGHYWLSEPSPKLLVENVACVDYSVAKGGFLCAYRWNGEQILRNQSFACGERAYGVA
jgi:hypothetical protein